MNISKTTKILIEIEDAMKIVEQKAKFHADQVLFFMQVKDQLVVMQNDLINKLQIETNKQTEINSKKINLLTLRNRILNTFT
ncbi:MAG: hypothetical protein ACD_33C00045G0028 [uncultured bacterium]|nr:MAG: hypothetical protein ACD_33C00045G0028 [uncultured bacterium]